MERGVSITTVVVWLLFPIWLIAQSDSLNTANTPDSLHAPSRQIELSTYVEKSRVPLNQPVIFHVHVSWIGELSDYKIDLVSQPILTNLLLEGSGAENRLEPLPNGKQRAIKSITYRFKPLEMGMAYIDGIVVKYTDAATGKADELKTQRIMIEVTEPVAESGGVHGKAIIYGVLLVLFFGVLLYAVVLYFRKKKQHQDATVPVVSIPEKFLTRLAQEVDPRGTNLAEMTQRLSRIFREYLDQDFGIPAREMSTSELLTELEKLGLEAADYAKLKDVLQRLDMIKFAGKNVDPAEFTGIYGAIENFLLKRKTHTGNTMVEAQEAK